MKKLLLYSLSLAIVALSTVTAYASIPASDGTITGCYKPSDGKLFVIDSTATCPSGTNTLTWNQAGPQGPTGATGATGATGPQGPAGMVSQASFTNLNQVNATNLAYTNIATVTIVLPTSETVEIQFTVQTKGPDIRYRITADGNAIVNPNPPDNNSPDALYYPTGQLITGITTIPLSSGTHVINVDAYPFCAGCSGGTTFPVGPVTLVVTGLG